MKTCILPAGTKLFHGTDCAGEFDIPDGPAWFCPTREGAEGWVDWSKETPRGRKKGPGRVLGPLVVARDLILANTILLEDWRSLGEELLGDPDPLTGDLARAVVAAGLDGWAGRAEVMVSKPHEVLSKE